MTDEIGIYQKLDQYKLYIILGLIILSLCYFSMSDNRHIVRYNFMKGLVPYPIKNNAFVDLTKLSSHLMFRFLYVMDATDYDEIGDPQMFLLFKFKKDDVDMVCIFTKSNFTKDIQQSIARNITRYTYKMYDTYVTGSTRIFNDIDQIIMCQGYDRDAVGLNCISTVQMNEICSNKMEYIRYFVKHGLMINTEIKTYNRNNLNKFKKKYLKSPYSSRSACVGYENIDRDCYLDDGIIVQEPNNMLNRFEYKCYTLNGLIYMVILRMEGRNYNKCFMLDELDMNDPMVPPEAKILFKKYQEDIHKICHDTYIAVNAMVGMRMVKQKKDETNAMKVIHAIESSGYTVSSDEKLKIKYYLTSLVNNEKVKLVDSLNHRYKQNIDAELFTTYLSDQVDLLDHPDDLKIYDRFMRVDISAPDNGKYDRVTVTEIEPYASGIYGYDTIGKCMRSENNNEFININQYNLYKIISSF